MANKRTSLSQCCYFENHPRTTHSRASLPQKCLWANSVVVAAVGGGEEEIVAMSKTWQILSCQRHYPLISYILTSLETLAKLERTEKQA